MLISILATVVVLGVLIVLHEAGHFLVARLVGARVEVFSVGFGKRLWGFRRGETDYRISLVPLGGYVRIVGLGPDESDVVGEGAEETELLPRYKRALILLAGPLANVFGAVAFLTLAYLAGVEVAEYKEQPPRVGWIDVDSPAGMTDIRVGDLVVTLNGRPIQTWRDLEMYMVTSGGEEVELLIERDGERREVTLTPEKVSRYQLGYSGLLPPLEPVVHKFSTRSAARGGGVRKGDRITAVNGEPVEHFYDLIRLISPHPGEAITIDLERDGQPLSVQVMTEDDGGEGRVGIRMVFPTVARAYGFKAALAAGWLETVRMTRETFRVLGMLITGRASPFQLSGPLEIGRIAGEAARSGVRQLIWLTGIISLQLGIINLFPIPILDGGHLSILAVESAMRRDLSIRVKERLLEVGFYLLVALMVVVLAMDVIKQLPERIYNFFG